MGFERGRSPLFVTPPHTQPTTRKKKKDKKEKKNKEKKDAGAGADGGEMRVGGVVVPTYDELFKATGGKRLGALCVLWLVLRFESIDSYILLS